MSDLSLPLNVWYYGRENPLPEQIPLRAGPLSLLYEAGDLRYVRWGGREVLRRIYVAVRDRNWGTVAPRLRPLETKVCPDSFHIEYEVESFEGEIDFRWRGSIRGSADGTVEFRMDGVARATFWRCRIGFCILHPGKECSGARCRVVQAGGAVIDGRFPRDIASQAPFLEIRSLSHEVRPGQWAELEFSGDIFEMEDQRNWADASFKTFCTPLRLPYPVEIPVGTRVTQSVTLRLRGENLPKDSRMPMNLPSPALQAPSPRRSRRGEAPVHGEAAVYFEPRGSPPHAVPALGLGVASHRQPLSPSEVARLKTLNLSHLRVDLRADDPLEAQWIEQVVREASEIGVPLELALFGEGESGWRKLSAALGRLEPGVRQFLIFNSTGRATRPESIPLARRYFSAIDPAARFGAGTNANFAELNRNRPPLDGLDLVCYSLTPQVHAFDNSSLVETLEAHADTIASARRFTGPCALAITPITLKPVWNPYASGREGPLPAGELPRQVDVRQMSLLGAGWTLGSIKYVAEGGVASATYYETTGWRGVMETRAGSPVPDQFRSVPGGVFPLYHVLADAGEFAGGAVIPSISSDPLRVEGLILLGGERLRVCVANLAGRPCSVRVRMHKPAGDLRIKRLNENTVEQSARDPEGFRAGTGEPVAVAGSVLDLMLGPYEIARVDGRIT